MQKSPYERLKDELKTIEEYDTKFNEVVAKTISALDEIKVLQLEETLTKSVKAHINRKSKRFLAITTRAKEELNKLYGTQALEVSTPTEEMDGE